MHAVSILAERETTVNKNRNVTDDVDRFLESVATPQHSMILLRARCA